MTVSLCHLATLCTHLDVAVVLPVVQPLGDLRPARHLGPQRGDLGGGRPRLSRRPRRSRLVLVTELSQVPVCARRGPVSEGGGRKQANRSTGRLHHLDSYLFF